MGYIVKFLWPKDWHYPYFLHINPIVACVTLSTFLQNLDSTMINYLTTSGFINIYSGMHCALKILVEVPTITQERNISRHLFRRLDFIALLYKLLLIINCHSPMTSNNLGSSGACGVMVNAVGNGHSDQSSKPGQGCFHFT